MTGFDILVKNSAIFSFVQSSQYTTPTGMLSSEVHANLAHSESLLSISIIEHNDFGKGKDRSHTSVL